MDKTIENKIRKIVALMEGASTEGEATAAAAMFQKLLKKHNLSAEDIDLSDPNKAPEIEQVVNAEGDQVGRWERWMWDMLLVIADNFRCKCYMSKRIHWGYRDDGKRPRKNRVTVPVLLGKESDAALARVTYIVSCAAAKRLCRKYLNMRKKENKAAGNPSWSIADGQYMRASYMTGFVRGMDDVFREQKAANTFDIVLVCPKDVVEAYDNLAVKRVASLARTFEDLQAVNDGIKDGRSYAEKRSMEDDNESL